MLLSENPRKQHLAQHILLPLLDHLEMVGCLGELTPTNSGSSSALTAHTSNYYSLNSASPDPSKVWTDEKHRLYLNSLESSFVNQLHRYNALCGSLRKIRRHPKSSRLVPTTVCHKTLPQKNVKFERNEPMLESSADSQSIRGYSRILRLASCREQHYAASPYVDRNVDSHGEENCIRGNPAVSEESAKSSQQHHSSHVCHSDLVDSIAEVSDQNFVDDNQGDQSRCVPVAKGLKTVGSNSSGNKQVTGEVILSEKSNARNDATASQ